MADCIRHIIFVGFTEAPRVNLEEALDGLILCSTTETISITDIDDNTVNMVKELCRRGVTTVVGSADKIVKVHKLLGKVTGKIILIPITDLSSSYT